jgi:beta-lactamase class A
MPLSNITSPVHAKVVLSLLASFFVGCILGFIFHSNKANANISLIRENSSEYQFINPILIIDNSAIEFKEYDQLRSKIQAAIEELQEEGSVDEVSVYFRDLNTGKWMGVNEDALYEPSSMMKVVTLLAYLHVAQNDPEILTEKIYFENKKDPGQHYVPNKNLTTGEHTIRELLLHMIVNSDNQSMELLNSRRPDKVLEVFKELGLPHGFSVGQGFMSAADYSRVFRTLYSSTYLSRVYSEEALKLLSNTTFDQGLVAGVGKDVRVSHKFGEHTFVNKKGTVLSRELHDCGIIYKPGNPYFLCVMTKGAEFKDLERVIARISSLVHEEIF